MLHRLLFSLLLTLSILPAWAQVPEYDYFPPAACKAMGLTSVTVYESKLDNASDKLATGSQIRIAKNVVREILFDAEGRRSLVSRYTRGGEIVQQTMQFSYDAIGHKTQEQSKYFNTNLRDSTKVILATNHQYAWDAHNHCIGYTKSLGNVASDSVVYEYDSDNRLAAERAYHFKSGQGQRETELVTVKTYAYEGNNITVQSQPEGGLPNTDRYTLDGQGRKIREQNFGPGDSIPRLETQFLYNAKGLLQEIKYLPNWQYFQKDETVVERRNKYNSKGVLVEGVEEYGDGKRLVEYYDLQYKGGN